MHSQLTIAAISLAFVLLWSGVAQADGQTIVSPSDGAVYHPGDTVNVMVNNPAGGYLVVGGDSHYVVSPRFLTAPPYAFTVKIPSNMDAGTYSLSAVTPATSRQDTPHVATIKISVEPSTVSSEASLVTEFHSLYLYYPGQTTSVGVTLKQNGNASDVSYSNQLESASTNPSIASVQGIHVSAGTTPGMTTIRFTLQELHADLKVYNQMSGVRGDFNGDERVDTDDLNILNSALNTSATGPNDARDLNHDGKIDALDARILATLCTYARCATHP